MPDDPTCRERTVVRILLFVARILNNQTWIGEEIKNLSNHITAGNWGTK